MQTEAIRNLTREIPLNDFGLPTGIYRVDLLPFHDYQHATELLALEAPDDTIEPKKTLEAIDSYEEFEAYVEAEAEVEETTNKVTEYRIAGFLANSLQQAFMPLF